MQIVKDQNEKCALSENARQARNAYLREWNKKNPEKRKENARRYWEKKAARKEGEA